MGQRLLIDNRDGYSLRDMTIFLRDANQFIRSSRNEPTLFDFELIPVSGATGWVTPARGAFVRFEDDRWDSRDPQIPNGILFTGYITDEPEPVFLGTNNDEEVWAYRMRASSEDFLINLKKLPSKTYINKTRGYILRDLLIEAFTPRNEIAAGGVTIPAGPSDFPFNTDGILDGGIERIYQVDTNQVWTEIAQDFGNADRYVYRVLNGKVYYEPEGEPDAFLNDPQYRLVIDEQDPRFNPETTRISRVANQIFNDVTVLGKDEPTTVCKEYFVSDGYQPSHILTYEPYGLEESTIIEDDLTGSSIDGQWSELDTVSDFIQPYDGSLNITGGTDTLGEVYLRSQKGFEIAGVIECRDGEIGFAPGATGVGIIGGLMTSEVMTQNNCLFGFWIDADYASTEAKIYPIIDGSIDTTKGRLATKSLTRKYILRKHIYCPDAFRAETIYRGPFETQDYGDATPTTADVTVTWSVEELNFDDPNNVLRTSVIIHTETISTSDDFVLYSPINSKDLHVVINNVRVFRPSQIVVKVDNVLVPGFVGPYIDGGRCQLVVENSRAKVSWYAINQASRSLAYLDEVKADTPVHWWRLGDGTTTLLDAGITSAARDLTIGGGYNLQQPGAIMADPNTAISLNGSTGYAYSGGTYSFGNDYSIEAWIKTSAGAKQAIVANKGGANGLAFNLDSAGKLLHEDGAQSLGGTRILNDGNWHHVAVTVSGGTAWTLYVDGAEDATGTKSHTSNTAVLNLGRQADSPFNHFNGSLDEVAIYDKALSFDRIAAHAARGFSPMSEIVTVPPQGSKIEVLYYRKQQAMARVRNFESVEYERSRYHDDGVRQRIIRAGDVQPIPRNTEECLLLAQAYLADFAEPKYEGTYQFVTMANHETALRFWPQPGEYYLCQLDLPDGTEINQKLRVENVSSDFLAKDVYQISMRFNPLSKVDLERRRLLMLRKSSLEEPSLQDLEIYDAEILNATGDGLPGDPGPPTLTSVSSTQFTVQMAEAVSGFAGYEVRMDDTGWGAGGDIDRYDTQSFTITRDRRDAMYFIRPFKGTLVTPTYYSRRSALVRVAYPLANAIAVPGIDGEIAPSQVRVFISIPRGQKDFAGFIVRKDSATGTVLYEGDGLVNKQVGAGVSAMNDGETLTVYIENVGSVTSYTVYVATYNLVNEYGTYDNFTVSRQAPTITTNVAFAADQTISWAGTADFFNITVSENSVPVYEFQVPGYTTSWYIGGDGVDRDVEVTPGDDFGDGTPSTDSNNGDTAAPSAPQNFACTVVESPEGDGNLAFKLTWDAPASNIASLYKYEIEVEDNPVFSQPLVATLYFEADTREHIYYAPGVSRWFRIKAWNHAEWDGGGSGAWSTTASGTTKNVLDWLGPGNDWNYSTPAFNSGIKAITGGRAMSLVDDGTGRSLAGFDGSGDLYRDIVYGRKQYDAGAVPRTLIHVNNNVSALANGATVETGADRGYNAVDSNYRLTGDIWDTVDVTNGVNNYLVSHRGLTLTQAVTDGATVAGGSSLAASTLEYSDGEYRLKAGSRLAYGVKINDAIGTDWDLVDVADNVSALANGSTVEAGAGLANESLEYVSSIYRLKATARLAYGVQQNDSGGTARNIIRADNNVSSLSNGSTVEAGATRGYNGLNASYEVAVNLPYGIQSKDGGGTPRTIWRVGDSARNLGDVSDGGGYYKTDYNRYDGANRAYNGLNAVNKLSSGIDDGANWRSVADLWSDSNKAANAIENDYTIALDCVDNYSLQVSKVAGQSLSGLYRTANDLTSSGSGFDRSSV